MYSHEMIRSLMGKYDTDDQLKAIGIYLSENQWLEKWFDNMVDFRTLLGIFQREGVDLKESMYIGSGFIYKGVEHNYQRFAFQGPSLSINEHIRSTLLSHIIFSKEFVSGNRYNLRGFIEREARLPEPEDEVILIYKNMYCNLLPPIALSGAKNPAQMQHEYAKNVLIDLNFIVR